MTTQTLEVTENLSQSRFELRLDGELVGIEGVRVEGDDNADPRGAGDGTVVAFVHTVILEEWSHRGLAARLVHDALEQARERGWSVLPVCTYVQRYLEDHEDFADVIRR